MLLLRRARLLLLIFKFNFWANLNNYNYRSSSETFSNTGEKNRHMIHRQIKTCRACPRFYHKIHNVSKSTPFFVQNWKFFYQRLVYREWLSYRLVEETVLDLAATATAGSGDGFTLVSFDWTLG